MPFPEQQVEWLLANRAKILRFAFVPQLLAAVALLSVAYFTGKTDAPLLFKGTRTRGKIVGFQPRELHTHRNPSSTGRFGRIVYLPIVEFEAQGTVVRFEEHKLVVQGEGVGWPVAVLYDPDNLSLAMIDRPFWNWIPWAPALVMGAFLALVSLKGLFSSSSSLFLSPPQLCAPEPVLALLRTLRSVVNFLSAPLFLLFTLCLCACPSGRWVSVANPSFLHFL